MRRVVGILGLIGVLLCGVAYALYEWLESAGLITW